MRVSDVVRLVVTALLSLGDLRLGMRTLRVALTSRALVGVRVLAALDLVVAA